MLYLNTKKKKCKNVKVKKFTLLNMLYLMIEKKNIIKNVKIHIKYLQDLHKTRTKSCP